LCAEDYNWWWRSFLTSGFTAVYFFFYSVYYFATKLEISGGTSTFLYFGYTLMLTFILFLFTGELEIDLMKSKLWFFVSGTIGFLACFWFVRTIYSVIKVD
jgi:transmembrane 9 superfamily protein 2/4